MDKFGEDTGLTDDKLADLTDVKDELRHSSVVITGDIYINPNVERRKKYVDKLDNQLLNSVTEKQDL